MPTISALDSAFDRLLEAAAELRRAEALAHGVGEKRLASDARLLAHAVEAEIHAAHSVVRRALIS